MPSHTPQPRDPDPTSRPMRRWRIGAVSFFNSKPLIDGLDAQDDIDLSLRVPSALLEGLINRTLDVALLPVIDYQRLDGARIIPAGGIGCDGPTLTVRIFSQTPAEKITTLACDPDSHTSVALARIILAERYAVQPRLIDLSSGEQSGTEAMLLIGDKVVCEQPAGMPHQLDLGEEWKALTGLPFVFAVWTARAGVRLGDLPNRLTEARRLGMARVDELVSRFAVPRGWPADLARRYLTEYLQFDIGPRQLDAIRWFHSLAHRHGLIAAPRRLDVAVGD